jgi:hypothetical protein
MNEKLRTTLCLKPGNISQVSIKAVSRKLTYTNIVCVCVP